MSRIGRQPIELPQGVKAHIAGQLVQIEGPKGKLEREVRPEIEVQLQDGKLLLSNSEETSSSKAFHGLERALLNNMAVGVSKGFEKQLHLIGVGYRAEVKGSDLELGLGFSHPVTVAIPEGLKGSVLKEGREIFVKLEGADKQLVGQVAAKIRKLRPPEPYKGKGIRYRDEVVKRKAGKAGKK